MIAFTADDLLVSAAEQAAFTSALANSTVTDPIGAEIASALDQVDAYTARYQLPEPWVKKLVRALVLYHLYDKIGEIPKQRSDAYTEAMKELKDIRDGKFTNLAENEIPPGQLAEGLGEHGSQTRLGMRTEPTTT